MSLIARSAASPSSPSAARIVAARSCSARRGAARARSAATAARRSCRRARSASCACLSECSAVPLKLLICAVELLRRLVAAAPPARLKNSLAGLRATACRCWRPGGCSPSARSRGGWSLQALTKKNSRISSRPRRRCRRPSAGPAPLWASDDPPPVGRPRRGRGCGRARGARRRAWGLVVLVEEGQIQGLLGRGPISGRRPLRCRSAISA